MSAQISCGFMHLDQYSTSRGNPQRLSGLLRKIPSETTMLLPFPIRITFAAILGALTTCGANLTLDFNDGQLPSAHGWTYSASGTALPETTAYSVSAGILAMDTMNQPGESTAMYSQAGVYNTTVTSILEFRFQLIAGLSSSAATFQLDDGVGRTIEMVIGSSQVGFYSGPSTVDFVNFTTTDQFHRYAIVIPSGSGAFSFYADDVLLYTGSGSPTTSGTNSLRFGDGTLGGDANWRLDYLNFSEVPEPATCWPLALGILAIAGGRRR